MALPLLKNETLAIAGLSHYNRNAFTVLSHYITDLLKKQRKGNILHTGYFKHINNCNCDHVFWAVKLCKIVCVIHTTQNKKLKKKKKIRFFILPMHSWTWPWITISREIAKPEYYSLPFSSIKASGQITTYPFIVWSKFKLFTYDLKFNILLTWS